MIAKFKRLKLILLSPFFLFCFVAFGDDSSDKPFKNLQSQLKVIEKTVSQQAVLLEEKELNFNSRLRKYKNEQKKLVQKLDALTSDANRSTLINKFGAIAILFGLLIEIIGAIFLASEVLTRKCEPVRNLNPVEPSKDLAMENVALRPMLTFLTYCGAFLLFSGFTVQALGTFVILDIPLLWMLSILVLMILVSLWISYFVAGRTLEQAPLERLLTLADNAKFSFGKAILYSFNSNPKCDVCGEPLKQPQQFISYYQQENSDDYPYLHPPGNFLIGHERCLNIKKNRDIDEMNTKEQKDSCSLNARIVPRAKFIEQSASMISWHREWRQHWAERRANDLGDGPWFRDLQRVLKRIKGGKEK